MCSLSFLYNEIYLFLMPSWQRQKKKFRIWDTFTTKVKTWTAMKIIANLYCPLFGLDLFQSLWLSVLFAGLWLLFFSSITAPLPSLVWWRANGDHTARFHSDVAGESQPCSQFVAFPTQTHTHSQMTAFKIIPSAWTIEHCKKRPQNSNSLNLPSPFAQLHCPYKHTILWAIVYLAFHIISYCFLKFLHLV